MHRLICHPDTPARGVKGVEIEWLANGANALLLTCGVTGAKGLTVPEPATPGRADGLWRTTCFELFWRAEGSAGYVEVNLSPSGRWAAYAFDGYRSGMRDHPMASDPRIKIVRDGDRLVAEIEVDRATLPGGAACVGLSAVIEEADGTKSYWALAHGDGPPDFHDPRCFVLSLPAAI